MNNIKDVHFIIDACRGFSEKGCPNRVAPDHNLLVQLDGVISGSPWKKNMTIKAGTGLKAHEKMKLSLSGCPNGCSRPHIYDMGIIGAVRPLVNSSLCTGCRVCADVCREEAISIVDDKAVISPDKCLLCGECIPVCPDEAITSHEQGYRIVVGGRLGRHPRLARERKGLYSLEQAKLILWRLTHMHQTAFDQGVRLSSLIFQLRLPTTI